LRLTLTAEQDELRATVRRLVDDQSPSGQVRAAMAAELGYDPGLWQKLAAMGVLGLVIPEASGGAGYGYVERSVVAEELGRGLVPSPFLGSAVFAVDTLLALGDKAGCEELLAALAAGEKIAAVAAAEPGRPLFDTGACATTAEPVAQGWTVTGSKSPVVAGDVADVIIVHAQADDGPALFLVDGTAAGLARTVLQTFDPTRRLARLDFRATPAVRLNGDATVALETAAILGAVAIGGEQVGGMRRALDLTVDYAKIRVQFGRPIGSFQAVKHACADMYCTWEQAYSAVRYASWAADEDRPALPLAAAVIQAYVGPGYFEVAKQMVLSHGGLGYTWEHDAHLYYKRAKSDELLLGTPGQHLARLADLLAP
jgi:acyl-CoA dehydrogenase